MSIQDSVTANGTSSGLLLFGVQFTAEQKAALKADQLHPQWGYDPPQREECYDDRSYAVGLREYADRLIAANKGKKQ